MSAPPAASIRELYFNRRVLMMLPLGFASGLPLALTGSTLAAWARASGVSLSQIGLLGLVSWPYAMKFLWAALIDRYSLPFLDRRRSWIIIWQLLLIIAIAAMGFCNPAGAPLALGIVAVCVALFSASQDIPLDAYRTDILDGPQRGSGTAIYVGGYRLGMVVSGGLALVLADWGLSWTTVYLLMAACMGIGIVATLLSEPANPSIKAPASLQEAVVAPLMQFFLRPSGWLVIAFVIVFKLPDITASQFSTPFLMDLGFSMTMIGAVNQVFGLAVSIIGALAGGLLVGRFGLRPSLWIFGILHGVANLGFWVLTFHPGSRPLMVTAIGVENFCAGLVTAGFTAFLMSQCDKRYSAFQFALLTGGMALSRVIAVTSAGFLADHVGWRMFFLINMVMALPGMALLPFIPISLNETDGQSRVS